MHHITATLNSIDEEKKCVHFDFSSEEVREKYEHMRESMVAGDAKIYTPLTASASGFAAKLCKKTGTNSVISLDSTGNIVNLSALIGLECKITVLCSKYSFKNPNGGSAAHIRGFRFLLKKVAALNT